MPTAKQSIRCPHCNSAYCPVQHTQQYTLKFTKVDAVTQQAIHEERVVTRRFRICQHCDVRFSTVETLESDTPGKPLMFEPGPETLTPKTSKPKRKNPFVK